MIGIIRVAKLHFNLFQALLGLIGHIHARGNIPYRNGFGVGQRGAGHPDRRGNTHGNRRYSHARWGRRTRHGHGMKYAQRGSGRRYYYTQSDCKMCDQFNGGLGCPGWCYTWKPSGKSFVGSSMAAKATMVFVGQRSMGVSQPTWWHGHDRYGYNRRQCMMCDKMPCPEWCYGWNDPYYFGQTLTGM